MIILFNKPYQVLSQFTDQDARRCLSHYIPIANVYPAGRLDRDSEGLLVLTDDGQLQQFISDPRFNKNKTYWAQIERIPSAEALQQLRDGLVLKDGPCKPAKARIIDEPDVWPRHPPIRERQSIPTCWLELVLSEGRNRQVRRMTAAIGHPTLRLIRCRIGPWSVHHLQPGEYCQASLSDLANDGKWASLWRKIQRRAADAHRHSHKGVKRTQKTPPIRRAAHRNRT